MLCFSCGQAQEEKPSVGTETHLNLQDGFRENGVLPRTVPWQENLGVDGPM